jgi:predicted MPP superfamily phosphohydrolase
VEESSLKRNERINKIICWLILVLISLLGMFIAAGLFSSARFAISAFELTVELIPFKRGDTVIFLPPVGELTAATHRLPFLVKLTLLNVDLELLAAELEKLGEAQNLHYFLEQLQSQIGFYLLRMAAITFICGASAVFLLLRPKQKGRIVIGGLLAVLFFLLLFFGTIYLPFDSDAFNHPRYTGAISAAPWVINLSEQTVAAVKSMGEQLEIATANLHSLAQQLEQVRFTEPANGLRVLHVSDIHNNPAAFDFIEKVVSTFQIDLIIDTGDLTDYGSSLEAELITRLTALPVPYVFIPGNHDSPQVIETMRQKGAIVLESDTVEIRGLHIFGIADPSASRPEMAIASDQYLRYSGREAYRLMRKVETEPDIVAVHNPLTGEGFSGKVPLILSGHTHRARVALDNNNVSVNAGTTGAAGVRGLYAPGDNPYSMVVLYFSKDKSEKQTLVMADLLSVHQSQDSFTLQRYYNKNSSQPVTMSLEPETGEEISESGQPEVR